MSQRAVLRFLCVVGVFLKGQTALIQSQPTVLAALGDSAFLNCRLTQSKDVVQVTWQKISPEGEKDLATSNKYFGQKVNPEFRERVEFEDVGLHSSSIVIRNLTHRDEGCYLCLFNTNPDGALTGRTCLQLYELHAASLHVRESNSAEEVVVSCSATGRPAPTVTLIVPHYNTTNTTKSTNTNGTVTVTATAAVPRLRVGDWRVGCAVRVLSGRETVMYAVVPEVELSPSVGVDVESGSDISWTIGVLVLCFVVVAAAAAAAAVVFYRRKQHNRQNPQSNTPGFLNSTPVLPGDSEKNEKDSSVPGTPLMNPENQPRFRRSPPAKNESSSPPKSSVKRQQLSF
ncbi:OX-2 membrane glycoprotein-like [Pseudoliparis swirei]|uniref:OX-2 membrane glycoprotein-like n=1 Tax=Pseudoliparis swirei TaxID=2059687 RepID=UPI0024BE621B|nr:OX-2 membrane glycoprotein-like [Pseudoliparis swirei]